MKKHFRIVLTVCVLFAAIILILAACNKQSGGDRSDDIVVTDVPTMRPTEVPMRDISGDTPLADTVVYANRMANEVQAYFSNPDRTAFTGVNYISKFELELSKDFFFLNSFSVSKSILLNTTNIFLFKIF